MTLTPGTRLGPYEILAPLGAGGQGEVFRARDSRLSRDVALKVLPDHLRDDPKALARFESEARAVAALSHPHILAIHDFGRIDGTSFAVAELLEGETLRALLLRGPLPPRRALEIARPLADALAAAHARGIVHRDLKPENVFLTRDGLVKLLDFGLARHSVAALSPEDTHSPTAPVLTDAGSVLGTVAYMSPEQARGLPADHRSDQFSLGVLLYEMLSGKRPFKGDSAAETLTAIIREEPEPLGSLAPAVPAPVRWIVERCLAKDPDARFDSTRDLARDLAREVSTSRADVGSGSAAKPREEGRSLRLRPGSVAAVVSLAVLATAAVTAVLVRGLERTAPPTRFEIRLPEGHYLSRYRQPFAFSPDGRLLVYSAFTWKTPFEEPNPFQLFLRPLDSFEAKPIPGTEGGFQPVFSPDGRHVAFAARAEEGFALRRVPVAGGPVSTVCQSEIPFGLVWSADGHLIFAEEFGPVLRVPATGGTPEAITKLDVAGSEISHRLPHLLPDGRTLLYTSLRWSTMGMSWKEARVFSERVGETGRRLVADWASDARWAPPGHVLFAREGRLYAAPFDAKSLSLGGAASPILESVSHAIWTAGSTSETGAALVDFAAGGLVAWVNGGVTPQHERSLAWVDASGNETPVDVPRGPFVGGRLSPDGGRLLVQYAYPGRQLEVLDLARGARRNVTFGMNPRWAVWGPGPGRITFQSDHEGPWRIYSRRVDAGSEEVETLWQGEGSFYSSPGAWSRDGRVLAFRVFNMKTRHDIWLLERGKGARPLVASPFSEMLPDISPDGRWLVYTSNEPGRYEVFVRPLEGDGASEQVSAGGGSAPIWSADGSVILYWSLPPGGGRSGLFRVRFGSSAKGLSLGRPEKLLEAPYEHLWPGRPWDLAPDGRVLIVRQTDPAVQRTWFEKALGDRIRVDLGGLPALLEEAGKSP